jgi:iron-sulfur cluster assembly protein
MITVSDSAKNRINQLLQEENKQGSFLRVGVKGGGCSGLSYKLDFDDKLNEDDEIINDNGVMIICDKKSLLYLFGTELHFSDGLNGKGFEFINTQASRVCSCGQSFSV